MTSTTVTDTSKYLTYVAGNVNAAKDQKGAFTDCFSQMCTGQTQSDSGRAADKAGPVKRQDELSAKTDYGKKTAKAEPKKAADKVLAETGRKDEALTPEEQQAIGDAAQEIVEAVAAQLGLTVEQVQNRMAQLEMTPADLLNAEQVTQLMVELGGEGNPLELLTNEQLFGAVEQVTQKVEQVNAQLAQELQVTPQELESMLTKAMEESGVPDGTQAGTEENVPDGAGAGETKQTLTQTAAQHLQRPDTESEAVIQKDKKGEPVITVENEKPLETVNKQEEPKQENTGKEDSGGKSKNGQAESGQTYLEQLNGQNTGKTDMTSILREMAGKVSQAPDTQDIMRQIMDYMKVQVKADMTQMEIQLHPASLGNVNIHISSKEGVITAQFTAQNEAVKTALETQVIQLKENLEQQGVKVEAVEVTVASHAFERNLQQGQEEGRGETEPDKKKTAGRTNLNLSQEGAVEFETLDDADRIAADMMARNGNMVDFSA